MNIFYLHPNPTTCAAYHADKHVVKMILEYAQLLSTAHRVIDGTQFTDASSGRKIQRWQMPDSYREDSLYKATHVNHPSAVWCRASSGNYSWLYSLFIACGTEYTFRYGKTHLTISKLADVLEFTPDKIPIGEFTEPTQAMPDEVKIPGNSLQAYRNYYKINKAEIATWKVRPVPEWFTT